MTVASTLTLVGDMVGLPRSVYSRDPSSWISDKATTSPTRTSFRRGTVRRSRGARRYLRPATVATIYCDGCERMRSRAEDVVEGSVCRHRDGTVHKKINKIRNKMLKKGPTTPKTLHQQAGHALQTDGAAGCSVMRDKDQAEKSEGTRHNANKP